MSISVVINTYNAGLHLAEVLESVKDFDEVLICDMESTDNTLEIARHYGCNIVTFPKGDHKCAEPARNFAIHSARCIWVFQVDADEIVSPELREYLYEFVKNPGNVKGLYIPRKNYILNIWKRSNYPDYQLRFFNRDATYWPPAVHTFPVVKGDISRVPAGRTELALHHKGASITDIMERLNRYTSAEVCKRKGTKVSLLKIMFDPWWKFFSVYILRGAWRYGIAGYISARNDAFYRYVRLAKLYESTLKQKDSDPQTN